MALLVEYAPANSIPVLEYGGVQLPTASGGQVLVVAYTVPKSFRFILRGRGRLCGFCKTPACESSCLRLGAVRAGPGFGGVSRST